MNTIANLSCIAVNSNLCKASNFALCMSITQYTGQTQQQGFSHAGKQAHRLCNAMLHASVPTRHKTTVQVTKLKASALMLSQ